jgi:CRISPR system Cascade subunit CasD
MYTLLLNIHAPWVSWGYDSSFENRRTLRRPTKSAIVGLLAASLGWDRDHSLEQLNALRFGVRVESEGVLEIDYHTAANREYRDGRGPKWTGGTKVTHRSFLSDAKYVVGLESDNASFMRDLVCALKNPVYAPFFGRKQYPVNPDFIIGLVHLSLDQALRKDCGQSYTAIETPNATDILLDTPESFSMTHRKYSSTSYVVTSDHYDPMSIFK